MIKHDFLHQLSAQAAKLFPAAGALQKEIEENLFQLLNSSFSKLNLVTREELDGQLRVLERTRHSLTEMEAKMAELESKLISLENSQEQR